jgi:tRNA (guanine10-N2)-dimethyltransferase
MILGLKIHKEQSELAKAEIYAITGKRGRTIGEFYVITSNFTTKLKRLAFTKEIYDLKIRNNMITHKRKRINLTKHNRFQSRRAHLLPAGHPSMTHPRLARAMINLSNATTQILDPFCGAGGILIEAGLCDLKTVGFDVDPKTLTRAEKNLRYLKCKDYRLILQDATKFSGYYESIVTDLPYGKNTKITEELEPLYSKFLSNIKQIKIKKLVIGFPDYINHRRIIRKTNYNIKQEFSYYLHKNLSKTIVTLI